jgi:hypothetical protein
MTMLPPLHLAAILPDWSLTLLAWLTFLAAAGIGLWWWRGDPSHGRRRCGRCWYLLGPQVALPPPASKPTTPTTSRCPECGWKYAHESRVYRTRRPRRRALLALVTACSGWTLLCTPEIRQRGPGALVPDTALLCITFVTTPLPSVHEVFARWLNDRADAHPESLWSWQRSWAVGMVTRKRTKWRNEWPAGLPVALHPDADILHRPPAAIANAPPQWHFDFRTFKWLPIVDEYDQFPWAFGSRDFGNPQHAFWSEPTVVIDAGVVSVTMDHTSGAVPLVIAHFPITRVTDVNDIITPISGPAAHDAVTAAIRPRLVRTARGQAALEIPSPESRPMVDGKPFTVALSIEVQRDGVTVATGRWRMIDTQNLAPLMFRSDVVRLQPLNTAFAPALETLAQLTPSDEQLPRWSVRISGDGTFALRDFAAQAYWAGEMTIPVKDLLPPPSR